MLEHKDQGSMDAPLEQVRQAFEQWRSTRTGRERIPEDLWQAAVDLADSHSPCKVAAVLRPTIFDLNRPK